MVPIPGVCTDYTGGVISHESTEGHTWGRQEKRSSTYVAPRGQSEEETALEASLYPYSTRWNKEFQMSDLPLFPLGGGILIRPGRSYFQALTRYPILQNE